MPARRPGVRNGRRSRRAPARRAPSDAATAAAMVPAVRTSPARRPTAIVAANTARTTSGTDSVESRNQWAQNVTSCDSLAPLRQWTACVHSPTPYAAATAIPKVCRSSRTYFESPVQRFICASLSSCRRTDAGGPLPTLIGHSLHGRQPCGVWSASASLQPPVTGNGRPVPPCTVQPTSPRLISTASLVLGSKNRT